ncbi:MAG: sigma-70 family RNA polymerase sigma factor [Sedimentisphaerales bacterium]|nr:sigma-70 family RNA polymerase sigma factor [Sedimentisphaerales bacterium]
MAQRPTDDELVRRYKDGDIKAFEELYGRYHRYVFHICYSYLKNIDDAEDMKQTVFQEILHKIWKYQGLGNFKDWLGTVIRNRCRDAVRSSSKINFNDCEFNMIETDEHNPSKVIEDKETAIKLLKYISQLDEPARTIICDRIIYTIPMKDIANYCSISFKHAYRIYHRTLNEIKMKFNVK